jgi:anti-anti-sigma regulatory factor
MNAPSHPEEPRRGALGVTAGAGLSDHACWGYRSAAERADVTSAWLTDGLALGQQALYIGDGSHDELLADLVSLPGRDAAIAAGALVVASVRDTYDHSGPIDAAAQVATFDTKLGAALADGYTGICAVGDVTTLLVEPAHRTAFLHWEQVSDRYVAGHPVAPLCMYDARVVGAVDAIRCAHRLHGPDPVPFTLHATSETAAAMAGELDAFAADVLADILATAPVSDEVLDVAGVDFLDARTAWVLQGHLRRRRSDGRPLAVVGAGGKLRRIWDVCGFDPTLLSA